MQPSPHDIYTLSLHDALPILPALPMKRFWPLRTQTSPRRSARVSSAAGALPTPGLIYRSYALTEPGVGSEPRSEENTSELQSLLHPVSCLLLVKKNNKELSSK